MDELYLLMLVDIPQPTHPAILIQNWASLEASALLATDILVELLSAVDHRGSYV